jgi:hypothetical protein
MTDPLKMNLTAPTYTPGRLIDAAKDALGAPNDNQLSFVLQVDGGQLHRIRYRKNAVSPGLMVAIMDRTGWPITKVRELAGMPFGQTLEPVVRKKKRNV